MNRSEQGGPFEAGIVGISVPLHVQHKPERTFIAARRMVGRYCCTLVCSVMSRAAATGGRTVGFTQACAQRFVILGRIVCFVCSMLQ